MRAPAVPLRRKLISLCAVGLLACGLLPMFALADDSVAASFVLAGSEGSGEAATPNSAASAADSPAEGTVLASEIAAPSAPILAVDMALGSEAPAVGSFTADGLTFAVINGKAALVSVGSDAVSEGLAAIPAAVAYDGTSYDVTSVGAFAFYLSAATSAALPASITMVDARAFRSSDVVWVDVDAGNPAIASFDGALYSADLSSLLLIPEGRTGSVLLSCETEVAPPSAFSHCPLVTHISVEEGGAAYLPWEGCLYSADGSTLLRVPAGATEIAIRDGCTTIAAGAMEGCARLERINAPASVTSISPDLFTSIDAVSLPAASVSGGLQQVTNSQNADDSHVAPMLASGQDADFDSQDDSVAGPLAGPGYEGDARSASADSSAEGEEEASGSGGTQLGALVALSAMDDDLPAADPSSVQVALSEGNGSPWAQRGFLVLSIDDEDANFQSASKYAATYSTTMVNLTNSYAYPKRRVASTNFELTNPSIADAWTLEPGATKSLSPLMFDVIDVSSASGDSIGDHVVTIESAGAWISWFTSSELTVGSMSTMFSIYHEKDARTVVSAKVSPIPNGKAYLYRDGSSTVNRTVTWNAMEGSCDTASTTVPAMTSIQKSPVPVRPGYRCTGWYVAEGFPFAGQKVCNPGEATGLIVEDRTLEAHWEEAGYTLGFDVDSEPGHEGYPGEAKPDEVINAGDGQVAIENPVRPGYAFEGWVVPSADGTEAIDQDLVYKGDDGSWYVDALKLPDYADASGKVQLTARWTSVISVDVPSTVTFYADLVTQGQESREGAVTGTFGQAQVTNRGQKDLRVVGLESSAVPTTDTTLGADSILKKAAAATPSTSAQKLLSLYPSSKGLTADDLQNPDAVGGSKAPTAVDFDLDDVLLERSFKAEDFTIAAGSTLSMGYRLNLTEAGQELDYDKLVDLGEGKTASIANVSYTFAGAASLGPEPTGDKDDPFYVEVSEAFIEAKGLAGKAEPGIYGLADIKQAADDIAAHVSQPLPALGASADQVAAYWSAVQQQAAESPYYALYRALLDAQELSDGTPVDSTAPYFQLKVDGVWLPVQLIGIAQDTASGGSGKAGLSFQMREIYAYSGYRTPVAGGGAFSTVYSASNSTYPGWGSEMTLHQTLNSTFLGYLAPEMQSAIVGVDKYSQLCMRDSDISPVGLGKSIGDKIWILSRYEMLGTVQPVNYGSAEALTTVDGYVPFQYLAFQPAINASDTFFPNDDFPRITKRCIDRHNFERRDWLLRSALPDFYDGVSMVQKNGVGSSGRVNSGTNVGVAPCFSL